MKRNPSNFSWRRQEHGLFSRWFTHWAKEDRDIMKILKI